MARILVAEDSATQAAQMRALLEAAGYQVQTVGNGREALAAIKAQAPSAVLTDLDMPAMNGLELVVALQESHPEVPIILMTAFGSEETAVEALQRGAASYVPKKNLGRDLVDTLQSVLLNADEDHQQVMLSGAMRQLEAQFVLPNFSPPISALTHYVQDCMRRLQLGSEIERVRVGVALDTAVQNAVFYGNLQFTPEQLNDAYDLADAGASYCNMLEQRCRESPYRDRAVEVSIHVDPRELRCVVRHQGPGFDPQALFDSADPHELAGTRARGWLLARSIMNEVTLNSSGTEATLLWKNPR